MIKGNQLKLNQMYCIFLQAATGTKYDLFTVLDGVVVVRVYILHVDNVETQDGDKWAEIQMGEICLLTGVGGQDRRPGLLFAPGTLLNSRFKLILCENGKVSI